MAKYIICLLCLILMLAGCGKSPEEKAIEKAVEKSTGADAEVDLSNKGMKISGKTEEGAFSLSTGEGTEIPKDFPSDVLVYRPSKVGSAMNMSEGQSIALTTSDDSKKVEEAYKREMATKGWAEEASINMGTQTMLAYKKDDRIANITIVPSDDETQIMLIIAKD